MSKSQLKSFRSSERYWMASRMLLDRISGEPDRSAREFSIWREEQRHSRLESP